MFFFNGVGLDFFFLRDVMYVMWCSASCSLHVVRMSTAVLPPPGRKNFVLSSRQKFLPRSPESLERRGFLAPRSQAGTQGRTGLVEFSMKTHGRSVRDENKIHTHTIYICIYIILYIYDIYIIYIIHIFVSIKTMLNQDASRTIGVKPVACFSILSPSPGFEFRTAILQNLHDPPKITTSPIYRHDIVGFFALYIIISTTVYLHLKARSPWNGNKHWNEWYGVIYICTAVAYTWF